MHLNSPRHALWLRYFSRPVIGRWAVSSEACLSKPTNQLACCWSVHRFAGRVAAEKKGKQLAAEAASAVWCCAMDPRDNVETGETENIPELFYVPIPDEAPSKNEQEKLSGVVKNVHRKLRRKYREGKLPQRAPLSVSGPAADREANTEP